MLLITLKKSIILFGNKYYSQIDVGGYGFSSIFCVTTKQFNLKDAPRNSHWNI